MLVRTVIVQCTSASCTTGPGTRPFVGTTDVALSANDIDWLLPSTSLSFTFTFPLGILGDGLLDSLSMVTNHLKPATLALAQKW